MNRSLPGLQHLRANNIFCVGRNYPLHAKEMGSPVPERPMLFLKPNSSLLFDGGTVLLPDLSSDVHYEVELVAAIGKPGRNIPLEETSSYLAGIAVGIDLTARDLQSEAKKSGHPWSVSKGFDTFAPVSEFVDPKPILEEPALEIELLLNDTQVQRGSTSEMIFSLPYLISYISTIFTLQSGDLLFTGTPDGVGPVTSGDRLHGRLHPNLANLRVDVY